MNNVKQHIVALYKVLIIMLLIACPKLSTAQVYDKPGNYGLQYKRLASDIQFNMPFVDKNAVVMSPALMRPGALICHTGDSLIYMWTGTAFNIVDGSVPWRLGGNNVLGLTNFGTTSNFDIPFITNNTEKMRLSATGFLGIGNNNPLYHIDVLTNADAIQRIFLNNANAGGTAQSWIQSGNATAAAVLLAHSAFPGGKAGVYSTGAPLWLGTNLETPSGGTQPIIFAPGGTASANERMRLDTDGDLGIGVSNPTNRLDVNGIVRFTPSATSSATWSSVGRMTQTSQANVEDALNVKVTGQTQFMKIGTGVGGQIPSNQAFVITSNGTVGEDFGTQYLNAFGVRQSLDYNAHRVGFYFAPNSATTIHGALSGTQTGNSFQFGTNAINGGLQHNPTSGTVNFMQFMGSTTGSCTWVPSSGNAELNVLLTRPFLNQTGTAAGATRGVYDNPEFNTALARTLHRSFESSGDGNSFSFYAPNGAKFFNAGIGTFGAVVTAPGFSETIINTSGALAPTPNRHYFFSGAAAVWTLPAVAGNTNARIMVKNVGAGAITVNSNAGGNDIFTSAATNTMTVNVGDFVEFVNNGTFWGVE